MIRGALLILACCLAMGAWAAAARAGEAAQVVEAEGSYLMGDNDSRRQAREMALFEAKRTCMEKVGTYLVSQTEVENFQLSRDEIYSRAAARIQAEVIDEKWEHVGDTLRVTMKIRAVVRPEDFRIESMGELAEPGAAREPEGRAGQESARSAEEVRRQLEDEVRRMQPRGPEDPSKMLDLFYTRLQREEYREALRVANRIVEDYPRLGEAYFARALLFTRIGRASRAMADLSHACDLGHRASCRTLAEMRRDPDNRRPARDPRPPGQDRTRQPPQQPERY